jgi:hypothetical protein
MFLCHQQSILVIKDLKFIPNKNVVRINHTLQNDGVHSFLLNMTFQNLEVFTKAWAYFSIRAPADKNDREYKREILKTVVDIEKAFKGIQSNVIVSMFFESIIKTCDQELKLPSKKVRP